MKLIIGADIVPTESNFEMFANGNVEGLVGEKLRQLLSDSDFTMFNLEVPLTDTFSPIAKNGPNLIAPTSTITGLKAINPHFFTLANNHILDQGVQGLNSTIDLLNKEHIEFAGIGKNLENAKKSYIFEKEGLKVGVYCCTEREFSIATEEKEGANPFDPLESLDDIYELKLQCDFVVTLYHGGKEEYRYPSPYLQKVCRKIVDKGADLVVCQHSHCVGCEEKRNGSTIVYGQGNFLFDRSDNEYWKTGLLIEVNILKNSKCNSISYVPIIKKKNIVRLAKNEYADKILKEFYQRSEEIIYADRVKELYREFVKNNMWIYYKAFSGKYSQNLIYRIINKLLRHKLDKTYICRKYGLTEKIIIQNYIECEAHYEMILTSLKDEY